MPFAFDPRQLLACACAAVCGLASLVAQCLPGAPIAAPQWRTWLQGDPVVIGGDAAPVCAVFVFCTRRPTSRHEDADYLRALQRRFGAAGLRIVAVVGEVPEARGELQQAWAGCGIVVDDADATGVAWLGRAPAAGNVVAVDRRGVVAFLGRPESGLVDAIERTLSATTPAAIERERRAFGERLELMASFDDLVGAGLGERLAALLDHAPRDGVAHGLVYVSEATRLLSPPAARLACEAALARLRDEPRPLAAFADLALRSDPRGAGLARALVTPLAAAAAAVPNDPFVQLAHLRALVLAGDSREVGRHAMRLQKSVLHTADACLDFASILAADGNAAVHRDLAQRVLDRAQQLGADARLLTAARYGAALRCQEDPARAKQVLDDYLGDDEHASLNNDCWYLMTELATMGRYDWFAAGLAGRMLEQRDALQSHEFDTVALAMFLVGRVEEAIALQQQAIAMGGAGADYQQRLRRYQSALPMPPK
jgi:hypothetical protein